MAQHPPQTPALKALLFINFIASFGYSLVFPFLVVLVTAWGGNALIYGLIGASYAGFQFVGAPLLGRLSDRIGRRKVLIISQTGTALAWVLFLVAFTLPQTVIWQSAEDAALRLTLPVLALMLARALDGLTGGNVSVANALVADLSTEQTRRKQFARMGMASNLGTIVGPTLAGLFSVISLSAVFPVAGALLISCVGIVLVARLPRSTTSDQRCAKAGERAGVSQSLGHSPHHYHGAEHRRSMVEILSLPYVTFVLFTYFLAFFGFSLFFVAFPLYALTGLGWGSAELGLFFAVMSGGTILIQGPVLTRLSKRFSEAALISMGAASQAAGFCLFAFAGEAGALAAIPLLAFGNGIVLPSFMSCIAELAPAEEQGAVQGFASSTMSLANISGLSLGGIAYGVFGPVFMVAPAFCLAGVSALALLYIRQIQLKRPASLS